MALIKIGSQLKILAAATTLEDVRVDKALTDSQPKQPQILETKRPDFLYFRARAISAGDQGPLVDGVRVPNPNGNGDYFPRRELEASFETFVGRNLFLNHDSDHPIKSVGKIIDAYPVEDPDTGEFYIECLSKVDRKIHPEIARKVETGELDKVSMGCSCEQSMCSICGTQLHSDADQKCEHLTPQGLMKNYTAEIDLPDYGIRRGDKVQAFAINTGIAFNELSIVNVPADSRAIIKTVISNLKDRMSKKASLSKEEQLDLVTQMDKLYTQLDETTKAQVQAEFCGCPVKEASMSDTVKDEYKDILSKISAYEMEKLEGYIQHKTKKAHEEKKEVVAETTSKKEEESILARVLAKAKNTVAGKLFEKKVQQIAEQEMKETPKTEKVAEVTLKAVFAKNESDLSKSTWAIHDGDKVVLDATLADIWGDFTKLASEDQTWATSDEYATDIVARYKSDGLTAVAELWDVAHKVSDIKNSKVETPAKADFVKPGTETKADKEAEKTDKALDKVDSTEVGTHLVEAAKHSDKCTKENDASAKEVCSCEEPKKEAEAAPAEVVEKKADEMPMDLPKEEPKMEEPKPAEPALDEHKEELKDAPKPEAPVSAFDKLDDKIDVGDGYEAHKDKESNEIVVSKDGQEIKRLPDGFGDDVVSVMKLLRSMLGLPPMGDEKPAEGPGLPPPPKDDELPKADETPLPEDEQAKDSPLPPSAEPMVASKVDELTKKADELKAKEEELSKRAEELKKKEDETRAREFSQKINARSERCRRVVEAMVEREVLKHDEAVLEVSLKEGKALLDARHTALTAAVNTKMRELMAMDDTSLEAVEKTVSDIVAPQGNKKKATLLPSFEYRSEMGGEKEIEAIFKSMGTLKGK